MIITAALYCATEEGLTQRRTRLGPRAQHDYNLDPLRLVSSCRLNVLVKHTDAGLVAPCQISGREPLVGMLMS